MSNMGHGYGELTNLITLKKVWMVEHKEGVGAGDSPYRIVAMFFDENGKFLYRADPMKDYEKTGKP